jgi:hypothetical protein
MMKTKSSRKKLALLAFIVVALVVIGVTVWPSPKEAKADPVTYSVYCYWLAFGVPTPIWSDAPIEFRFKRVGQPAYDDWQLFTDYADGVFSIDVDYEEGVSYWQIRLNGGDYVGIDPWNAQGSGDIGTIFYVEWQLAFPMR